MAEVPILPPEESQRMGYPAEVQKLAKYRPEGDA